MEINDIETNVIGSDLDLTENISFNAKDKKVIEDTDKISFQLSLDDTPDIVATNSDNKINKMLVDQMVEDLSSEELKGIIGQLNLRQDQNKKGVRPELGILGICGYHVGNHSKDKKYRRQILDYIVLSELPKIGSPVYMDEWGLPNSSKRMEKLISVLSSLKRKKSALNYNQFEKAIIEWSDDLEYIKRKFSF